MSKRNNPEKVLAAILLSTFYALVLVLALAVVGAIVVGIATIGEYQCTKVVVEDTAPISATPIYRSYHL